MKGTVYNGKVRKKSIFFFIIILFPDKWRWFQRRELVRLTCARLAALSWCPPRPRTESHSCLLDWSFPLSEMSPAGEEERSCFIDWTDYFKQQCLIRISWTNSIRNSFWIVSCKGNSCDQVLWNYRWSCSFLIVTNGFEFYTTEFSVYSYPILWEC